MARGVLRYWAAARAAAGVAEEEFCADTLQSALDAAVARHGEGLARVVAVASFLVDGEPVGRREPGSVRLGDGATVEVLPPFAGGSGAAAPAESLPAATARRQPGHPVAAGIGAAAVALVIAVAGYGGRPALAAAVLLVQLLLTLAWFAVLDTPGSFGGFLLAAAAAATADGTLLRTTDSSVAVISGVLGISLVAALGHQLLRRRRTQITVSISGVVSAVVLDLSAAVLLGLRVAPRGTGAVAAALVGAGGALLAARLTDLPLGRPAALPGCTRGWPGLLVGALVGCAAGAGYAAVTGAVPVVAGVEMAAATAAVALAADIAVDLGRGTLAGVGFERQLAALTPLTVLLPLAVACPAAYVAGRVIFG